MSGPTYLLWVDLESVDTIENPTPPKLCEAAFLLLPYADFDPLHAQGEFGTVLHTDRSDWYEEDGENLTVKVLPVIYEMHAKSGLLEDSLNAMPSATVGWVQACVMDLLHDAGVERGTVSFAGSGVAAFDIPLIRYWMPELYAFAHYAPYDIGTARRAFRMYWPEVQMTPPSASAGADKTHRAMDDIVAHLSEARYVRDNFLLSPRPEPEEPECPHKHLLGDGSGTVTCTSCGRLFPD